MTYPRAGDKTERPTTGLIFGFYFFLEHEFLDWDEAGSSVLALVFRSLLTFLLSFRFLGTCCCAGFTRPSFHFESCFILLRLRQSDGTAKIHRRADSRHIAVPHRY